MVRDTMSSQDASTHQILRFLPQIILEICSGHNYSKPRLDVKVAATQNWYVTLRHARMNQHTKFGIPTSKNLGDMHRTRSGTDGQCDYYMPS